MTRMHPEIQLDRETAVDRQESVYWRCLCVLNNGGLTKIAMFLLGYFFATTSMAIAQPAGVVEGEVLVKYMDHTSSADRSSLEKQYGLELVKHHASIGIYHYRSSAREVWTLVSLLRSSPHVYFAEPNYMRGQQTAPNDPLYPDQWYLPAIKWEQARSAYKGTNTITVAVIDSGVSKRHKHLSGFLTSNGEWDFSEKDANADDESGHGTMVAGIITGQTDDGVGLAGICPKVRILPIRVFDNAGFISEGPSVDVSTLTAALDLARTHGARIINLSLGGTLYSYTERLALSACDNAGILLVCAAGNGDDQGIGYSNDGQYPIYPASYDIPGIISVAATDENGRLAAFSNFGASSVDVAAPGQFILGCDVARRTLYAWDFAYGWRGWDEDILRGNGWVWDDYLGRMSLVTSGPWPYYAAPYAPYSVMSLISPQIDLRGEVGARLEVDFIGSLGDGDYLSLSAKRNDEPEAEFAGILLYPGWVYDTIQRDVSRLDGSLGEVEVYLLADLFGWGAYSSGTLAIDYAAVTVLDRSAASTEAVWYADGTSFAAPIVSGVAALMMSHNPQLSHLQIRQHILNTAAKNAALSGKVATGGIINAQASLAAATLKSNQTVTFAQPAQQTYVLNRTFGLSASASSGLPVSFYSSNPNVLSISGQTATIKGVGTVYVAAWQQGNQSWNRSLDVVRAVRVLAPKSNQTVTFAQPAQQTYVLNGTFGLSASASSGLPVSFYSSNPNVLRISGQTATIKGVGTVYVAAWQQGNQSWNRSLDVVRAVSVKGDQVVSFPVVAVQSYVLNREFTLSATASSSLPVSFYSGNPEVLSISGNVATVKGAGTAYVAAWQQGNASWNRSAPVVRAVTVR
jgi:hypothetical protein